MSGKLLAAAVIAAGAYVWSSTSDEDESSKSKSKSPKKKSNLKNNKTPPKSRRLIVEPPFGAASPAANQPAHSRTPSVDTPMRPATYHTDESESMGLTMVRSLSRDGLNNMVRSLSRTSLSNLVDSAKKRLSVTEDGDDPSLVFNSTTEVMQPSHYHTDESESFTLQAASQVKSMVRSLSKTRLSDLAMSPTQNMRLDEDPSITNVYDDEGNAKNSTHAASSTTSSATSATSSTSSTSSNTTSAKKSTRNTDSFILLCIGVVLVGYGLFLAMSYPEEMHDPYTLFMDVFTFKRVPTTAQDIPSAIVATAIVLPFMWMIDCFVARRFFNNEIAQWYFLHSVANAFVVLLAVPDFYFAALQPMNSLSVQYCLSSSLPSWACNDWPTCIIIAVHTYHMCAFKLNGEDLFHHLTFVPIIGGGHFLYPW